MSKTYIGDAVEFRVLGEFEVRRDGSPVDLGPPKAKAVLAVLLLNEGAVVPTDRIVDAIWGEDAPRTAPHSVQTYISGLRRAFGDEAETIETRPPGYSLRVDAERIDAQRFGHAASQGASLLSSGDVGGAVEALERALEMWQGAPLPDFAYSEFAQGEIRRLQEVHADAVDDLGEAYLRNGNLQRALRMADAAVRDQPLRERSRAIQMEALAVSGRQAEALRAFSTYRDVLGEELGIEPSEALRQLEERILLQDPSLFSARQPARPAGNLPHETTSFVGRSADLDRIRDLLDGSRIVTLLGVGGVGKSRLALQVARDLADGFADGAWKIDFLGVTDPDHVVETTAAVLAPEASREGDHGLVDAVADRQMLVILDNCELVADGVARMAETLLQRAPGATVLATSREPLEVPGEVLWRVNPLESPDPQSPSLEPDGLLGLDSVRLFYERAVAADPTFELDAHSAGAVERICRLLEGIPLALELAAARLRHMTLEEIQQGLDERFKLLVGGSRTAPRRHRALDAAIDWSYQQLSTTEQEVFSRLGVFLREFPPEAAELACSGDGVEADQVRVTLDQLIDKSLVVRESWGGRTRCRLLDTVNSFISERLSGGGHHDVGFFLTLAQSTDPALRGPEEQMWDALLGGDARVARRALRYAHNTFREDQGAYLAGVAAALTTQTRRVGFMGGVSPEPEKSSGGDQADHERNHLVADDSDTGPSVPSGDVYQTDDEHRALMARFRNGFVAGVSDTDPSIHIDEVYLSEAVDVHTAFRSPALGREAASQLYAQECDVVFHAAGQSGSRVFEAARRMTEDTDVYRWGIGADVDEFLSLEEPARAHVLASVVKQVPIAVYAEIRAAIADDRPEEAPQFDLANDGVRLAATGGFLAEHADLLESIRDKIIAGDIDTRRLPLAM